MKPINSKERSKQVWQFIFIFFMLAVAPTALIFFSYYKLPLEMNAQAQQRLLSYSSFEKNQKLLVRNINEVDSNLKTLVDENTNENAPEVTKNRIANSLSIISGADSSRLISEVYEVLNHHLVHVNELVAVRNKLKKSEDELKTVTKDLQLCTEMMKNRPQSYPGVE